MMKSKRCSLEQACGDIRSGQTLLIGGFGQPGTPNTLLKQVHTSGVNHLTLVKNDASEPGLGVAPLLEAGQVDKMIASHIGLNPIATTMMVEGRLQVDIYPQGILAEKLRAAGTGLGGILSDIGLHLDANQNKERTKINGKEYLIEPALGGDVALIHATTADEFGNLVFHGTSQNFCLVMAMAARQVIVEVDEIVAPGEIPPDQVHLPAAFVDRLVVVAEQGPEYGVLKHHAL